MKATKGLLAAIAVSMTLAAGVAEAHPDHGNGRHYNDRGWHGAHWNAPKRSKRMPDWLYYKPKFRRWYRHSEVRYMRHLGWRQVYRIYQRQVGYRYYRHYRGHDYYDDGWDRRKYDHERPRHRRRG